MECYAHNLHVVHSGFKTKNEPKHSEAVKRQKILITNLLLKFK